MSASDSPADALKVVQDRYGGELDRVLASCLNGRNGSLFFGMMRYQFGYVDEELIPVTSSGGKRFRPLLCLLACESVGGSWSEALQAAAAIELLHNFSLIHDDIEDRDPERRHRPTVWKVWGVSQAINIGDAVFAEAIRTMLMAHPRPEICLELTRRFGDVALLLTEGQYLDMSFETRSDVTPSEYLQMIERKTADLIAFSMWAGAEIGSASASTRDALFSFGLDLGKAFQMHDDIMGIWAPAAVTGKEVAMDLRNRKKTLPVLIAGERSTSQERFRLGAFFARKSDDLADVLGILRRTEARSEAESHVRMYMERATVHLGQANLRPNARTEFESVARQLTDR